jgi:hypothetical protein
VSSRASSSRQLRRESTVRTARASATRPSIIGPGPVKTQRFERIAWSRIPGADLCSARTSSAVRRDLALVPSFCTAQGYPSLPGPSFPPAQCQSRIPGLRSAKYPPVQKARPRSTQAGTCLGPKLQLSDSTSPALTARWRHCSTSNAALHR